MYIVANKRVTNRRLMQNSQKMALALQLNLADHIHPLPFIPSDMSEGASVDILRLDKVHPVIAGNKWFKLQYNLQHALDLGFDAILSCGGVHSNHLHALAMAGQYFGLKVSALVRGYSHLPLTPTLIECQRMGMELQFLDKKTYAKRYEPDWCQQQAQAFNSYWIPEGGNNALGRKGCEAISQACLNYDEVWLSIGSGCTFTGIEQSLPKSISIKGVMAIKGGQELGQALIAGALCPARCEIDYDSHFGGFGRCPAQLIDFIHRLDEQYCPLDPVYTAKMVSAFYRDWDSAVLDKTKRYLLIHSGGLQGRNGIQGLTKVQ